MRCVNANVTVHLGPGPKRHSMVCEPGRFEFDHAPRADPNLDKRHAHDFPPRVIAPCLLSFVPVTHNCLSASCIPTGGMDA
ncbi:hypothetical protein EVC45_31345 [Paraburkholderia sp. UYCP14C]|nr:hypothetical protein EVC45_31345 [Paraburkholderia sp. UYCP14C]